MDSHQPIPEQTFSWRRDGLAVLFALLFPTVATSLYFVVLAGQPGMKTTYTLCKALQFAFPLVWVWLVQRRPIRLFTPAPLASDPSPRRSEGRHSSQGIATGILFGLLVLGVMLAVYYGILKGKGYLAEDAVREQVRQMGLVSPIYFLGMALFLAVIHSFLEEYYWRWFVFGQLQRALPLTWAILISSIGFALHHIIVLAIYLRPERYGTALPFFALCVAAGGGFWAWLYHRTGSLAGPWISHLLVDAGLMWIGFDLCRESWT